MTGEPLIEVVFMVADVNDVRITSPFGLAAACVRMSLSREQWSVRGQRDL